MNYAIYLERVVKRNPHVLIFFFQNDCKESATMQVLLKIVTQRLDKQLKIVQLDIH